MQPLHLIVHEDILREEIDTNNPTTERKKHLESVLSRIEYVRVEQWPHVKEFSDGLIPNIFPLVEGYETVILYGCTRKLCLGMIANGLSKRGYGVAFDIAGTTD